MGVAFTAIATYHIALKDGSTSCVATVEHYRAAIERQRDLNAYLRVYYAEALEKARLLDQRRAEGKAMGRLHGVVIGPNDVLANQDHPLSAASHILKDYISIYNATAVARLLEEEAIIIGHLNCDEFAM